MRGSFLTQNVIFALSLQIHYWPWSEMEFWDKQASWSTWYCHSCGDIHMDFKRIWKALHSAELSLNKTTKQEIKMTNSAGHLTPWLCILQEISETEVTYKFWKSHPRFAHSLRNIWDTVKPQKNFSLCLHLFRCRPSWRLELRKVLLQKSKLHPNILWSI